MAKWFADEEIAGLDPKLVEMLDKARGFAHLPFIITSGYRSREHNTAIGGAGDSSHTRGKAVDLRCDGSRVRFAMVSALLLAGFTRIGVYNRHLHADIDDSLPQPVMWTGESH